MRESRWPPPFNRRAFEQYAWRLFSFYIYAFLVICRFVWRPSFMIHRRYYYNMLGGSSHYIYTRHPWWAWRHALFYMLAESLPPLVLTRSLSLFRYILKYIRWWPCLYLWSTYDTYIENAPPQNWNGALSCFVTFCRMNGLSQAHVLLS